jgi:hypothetical protein
MQTSLRTFSLPSVNAWRCSSTLPAPVGSVHTSPPLHTSPHIPAPSVSPRPPPPRPALAMPTYACRPCAALPASARGFHCSPRAPSCFESFHAASRAQCLGRADPLLRPKPCHNLTATASQLVKTAFDAHAFLSAGLRLGIFCAWFPNLDVDHPGHNPKSILPKVSAHMHHPSWCSTQISSRPWRIVAVL